MRGSFLVVLAAFLATTVAHAQPSATPANGGYAPAPAPVYPAYAPTYYYYPAYAAPAVAAAPERPRDPGGVYFTESFGGINVSDELSRHMDGAVLIRGALGFRHKQLAVELWAAGGLGWRSHDAYASSGSYLSTTGGSTTPTGPRYDRETDSIGLLGLDVKYIKSLSTHLELYAKGSLSHAYTAELGNGPGLGVGAGAQFKGKVPVIGFLFWPLFFTDIGPKCTAAIFTETGYSFYRLHSDLRTTDAQLTTWTLGFAVGSDF